MFVVGPSVSRW